MELYYIKSTKYSIIERQTAKGKVYDVAFRIIDSKGKTVQKKLCGFKTKTAAKENHAKFIANCQQLPKDLATQKLEITVEELFGKYILTKNATLKDSSVVSIQNAFRRHVLPEIGKKKIDEITRSDAKNFIDQLITKRQPNGKLYSRKYLTNVRGFISSFFVWASERYDIINPFANVRIPKTTKQPEQQILQFWERDEFEKFCSAVSDPKHKALFATLFFAGCRKSEAFALSPKDYDGQSIHINKTVTRKTIDGAKYKITASKNARDYYVPVCEPLKKILDEYISNIDKNAEYLFGGDTPLAPTTVQRYFSDYIQKSNVRKIKIHGLRHSFVSMLIHHGANYMVVASLIADTPEQVLRTYGHLWNEDKIAIIKTIH